VVATINKQKLLTNEILWSAFNLFDKDGGGTISSMEVKAVLNCG
jgi:Ca2+-binding EF-hand superfamily protein